MNGLRIWLSWDSFKRNPERYAANFDTILDIAHQHGCLVMPVLFNRWHDRVLDYGGNVLRHGPVDQLQIDRKRSGASGAEPPAKECPECKALIACGYSTCPDCGYVFPPPERQQHEGTAGDAAILSGQVTERWYEVERIYYTVHVKRNADEDAPRTMRVDYHTGLGNPIISEWICVEHDGFPASKAAAWWQKHSPDPMPRNAERAVDVAEAGGIAVARAIKVREVSGEKFPRIVDYDLGPMPAAEA